MVLVERAINAIVRERLTGNKESPLEQARGWEKPIVLTPEHFVI